MEELLQKSKKQLSELVRFFRTCFVILLHRLRLKSAYEMVSCFVHEKHLRNNFHPGSFAGMLQSNFRISGNQIWHMRKLNRYKSQSKSNFLCPQRYMAPLNTQIRFDHRYLLFFLIRSENASD